MNWIHNQLAISIQDKLKELLKLQDKLLLVHFHELERLKVKKSRTLSTDYIVFLYEHYIEKGLTKEEYILKNIA